MTTLRTTRVAHPIRHPPVRIPQVIRAISYDAMEAWEERAAIIEYDGGLTRAEAEAMATERVMRTHRRKR